MTRPALLPIGALIVTSLLVFGDNGVIEEYVGGYQNNVASIQLGTDRPAVNKKSASNKIKKKVRECFFIMLV